MKERHSKKIYAINPTITTKNLKRHITNNHWWNFKNSPQPLIKKREAKSIGDRTHGAKENTSKMVILKSTMWIITRNVNVLKVSIENKRL